MGLYKIMIGFETEIKDSTVPEPDGIRGKCLRQAHGERSGRTGGRPVWFSAVGRVQDGRTCGQLSRRCPPSGRHSPDPDRREHMTSGAPLGRLSCTPLSSETTNPWLSSGHSWLPGGNPCNFMSRVIRYLSSAMTFSFPVLVCVALATAHNRIAGRWIASRNVWGPQFLAQENTIRVPDMLRRNWPGISRSNWRTAPRPVQCVGIT